MQVQTQSIVSSYALPPQSYLAAPPCSIYCKRAKPLQSQRHTYLAIHTRSNDSRSRLVGITEDLGRPLMDSHEPRAPTKRERKLRDGKVAGLDVVPVSDAKGGTAPVLISYENGNVDCISGDLSGTRWEHSSTDGGLVEYAAVVDLDTARRGLLKNREDVLALLGPHVSDSANGNTPLLCQVVRIPQQPSSQLRVYALRDVGTTTLQGQRSKLDLVLSYDVPAKHGDGRSVYELHASSGMLYQCVGQRVAIFDVSGTTPRLSFESGRKSGQVQSFSRLSAGAVIVVSQGRLAVYDTKFGSILGALTLPHDQTTAQNQPTPALLNHFTDLGILVALDGMKLIAFQLGEAIEDVKRSRAQGALLSDVIGKGKFTNEAQHLDIYSRRDKKQKKWEEWKTKVDTIAQQHDTRALERRVAQDIHVANDDKHEETETLANGVTNGAEGAYVEWDLLPQHFDSPHVDRRKAVYVLGKMFAWRSKTSGFILGQRHLELVLPSRNILRWLALAGYLTATEVEHALPQAVEGFASRPYIAPGDIIRAVSEADPSFVLLHSLLALPAYWELPEVVQALQVLIASFDDQLDSERETQQFLTNGDVDMIDDDRSEAKIEAEEAAAFAEVERVTNFLEAGVSTRSAAFRKCLDRLQEFPQKNVTKVMRAQMSQDDIIYFIHIMRLELANGGWTRPYAGQVEEELSSDFTPLGEAQDLHPSNQAIRTIANLLSCSVDAIGLSGWLIGQSGNSWSTEDLIESMVNETSAVVEGIYHLESLETFLREVEKTGASIDLKQSTERKRKHEEMEWTPEMALMPLGGRIEPPLLSGKKSKAVTAEQKSRGVGKYSFERIRI